MKRLSAILLTVMTFGIAQAVDGKHREIVSVISNSSTTHLENTSGAGLTTFVRDGQSTPLSIKVTSGLTRDAAWEKATKYLTEKGDEVREVDGNMEAGWHFVNHERMTKLEPHAYAVKIIISFSSSGSDIQVKTEAQHFTGQEWELGFDSNYDRAVKSELTSLFSKK
jgi:hypothetical protein